MKDFFFDSRVSSNDIARFKRFIALTAETFIISLSIKYRGNNVRTGADR